MISALLIRGRRGIGEDKSRAGGGWPFGGEGERTVEACGLDWTWRESEDGDRFESVDARRRWRPWNQRRPAASPLDLPPTAVAV